MPCTIPGNRSTAPTICAKRISVPCCRATACGCCRYGVAAIPVDGAGTPLWRTAPETSEPVFLGRDAGGYTWVTEDISHLPAADRDDNDRGPGRLDGLTADVRWLDLRGFGATLPAGLAATLAYARGMAFCTLATASAAVVARPPKSGVAGMFASAPTAVAPPPVFHARIRLLSCS